MLPILFQDERFVILDKPAGLPAHPGPRGGPSVEDVFPHLSRRRAGPWLAHRLDADTAGCLVVALRRPALLAAQAAFASGAVEKIYWAVVRPAPPGIDGIIRFSLSKQNTKSGWRMVTDAAGATAVTGWRKLGEADGMAWLELRPRTGRTHQIRVHCAAIGCPLVGDAIYGGVGGKLHLLARSIRLPADPPVFARAPAPAHMIDALGLCNPAEVIF